MRSSRGRILTAGTLAALAALVAAEVQAGGGGQPQTQLVSRKSQSQGGAAGNATSENPKISANGRFVAFTTHATNLGGNPSYYDVFVYDRRRRKLELVSRQSRRAGGDPADADALVDDISATGRFVSFSTEATNLGGPIATGHANVYVYDRRRDRVSLVSRESAGAGGQGGDDSSFDSSLSASGRFVAFSTVATNLGGPATSAIDVYVYDRERKRLELVSRQSKPAGGAGGDDDSERPSISGTGRLVAFHTNADNLGGPALDVQNIYVYDRKRDRVALVSRGGAGGADDESRDPDISANGRIIAFRSDADNLGGPAEDVPNIYLFDRERKQVRLVSRRGDQGADAVSYNSSVSRDGRLIAFDTEATNLGGSIQALQNVYLYDRETGRLQLVSRRSGRSGAGADDNSVNPWISAGGGVIAFQSSAGNLSAAAPGPPFSSIYVRQR